MRQTAISLFIDDTDQYPKDAFAPMIAFCEAEGVRGKVSVIPGLSNRPGTPPLGRSETPEAQAFMAELARAGACGFDVHMELMTHDYLWDFTAERQRRSGQHESIWVYEPEVPVAEFEAYFAGVLETAGAGGVTVDGVTVPGCDCADCVARYSALLAAGHSNVSDHAFEALLNLAEKQQFGVPVIAVFSDESDAAHPTRMIRSREGCGVYDARLDMSVEDQIGFRGIDPDFYITEDGRAGRIAELVLGGAEQCFFCAHWSTMNPTQPEGWAAFREIVRRINATLADRVEWMKPSDYGQRLLGN